MLTIIQTNFKLRFALLISCISIFFFIFITDGITDTQQAQPDSTAEALESTETKQATTVAPNLDLKDVAPLPEPVAEPEESINDDLKKEVTPETEQTIAAPDDDESTIEPAETEYIKHRKLILLGAEVPNNSSTRLAWSPQITISGLALPTPVLVINGANSGPTVCLTSAIHGDELNGIEVVRRVMYDIDPSHLNGTLIGVPIVNLQGFQRTSRYLSDRRDLNRYFPGDPNGSLASRIAHSFFTKVVRHCDYLIDIHTGSFRRNNLPQIRANMKNTNVAEFVENFDKIAVVHHPGGPGMLRTVANQAGITAITMELGESLRIQENQIAAGTHSINSMLDKLKMYTRTFIWGDPTPTYYESVWLRAGSGGILFSEMGLGESVSQGDVLGVIIDPITNQNTKLVSPVNGNIIGMAINQVVMPGFAAYHIGIESTQEAMTHLESDPQLDMSIDGEVDDPE